MFLLRFQNNEISFLILIFIYVQRKNKIGKKMFYVRHQVDNDTKCNLRTFSRSGRVDSNRLFAASRRIAPR